LQAGRQRRTFSFPGFLPPYRRIRRAFRDGDSKYVAGKWEMTTMNRSFVNALVLGLALGALGTAPRIASAQAPPQPPQCNAFVKLRDDAGQKAMAVRNANEHHADRKEICTLVTRFAAAETNIVKFLVDNKTWCNIPDQIIAQSKAGHEKTLKFRTAVCSAAEQAHPKAPTLSDAISTPSVDTAKNTKTGAGTLDTLTGNPLAK
jgi:hypothetical protein